MIATELPSLRGTYAILDGTVPNQFVTLTRTADGGTEMSSRNLEGKALESIKIPPKLDVFKSILRRPLLRDIPRHLPATWFPAQDASFVSLGLEKIIFFANSNVRGTRHPFEEWVVEYNRGTKKLTPIWRVDRARDNQKGIPEIEPTGALVLCEPWLLVRVSDRVYKVPYPPMSK